MYTNKIINWYNKHHNYPWKSMKFITTFWVIFSALTKTGDSVIMLTPIYKAFFNMIENHKLLWVECFWFTKTELILDFEEKIVKIKPKIFLFCSPPNSTSVESKWLSGICEKYEVLFFSDEIYLDMVVEPNKKHIVAGFELFHNNAIIKTSLGKTFNLNRMETSFAIIKNRILYGKIKIN